MIFAFDGDFWVKTSRYRYLDGFVAVSADGRINKLKSAESLLAADCTAGHFTTCSPPKNPSLSVAPEAVTLRRVDRPNRPST